MSSQTTEPRENANASAGGAAGVLDAPATKERPARQPSATVDEDRETLLELFHQMVLIRRFEEKCAESYSLGKIGGFCHLYIGQETVGGGAISAISQDDYLLTRYRRHRHAIGNRASPQDVQ